MENSLNLKSLCIPIQFTLISSLSLSLSLPPSLPASLPPVERPGLGCRELVVRNLSRVLPALARDVTDWLAPTRLKATRLLAALLLHAAIGRASRRERG